MIIKYENDLYQVLSLENKSDNWLKPQKEYTVISLRVLRQFESNQAYGKVQQKHFDAFTKVIKDNNLFSFDVEEQPDIEDIDYTKFLTWC